MKKTLLAVTLTLLSGASFATDNGLEQYGLTLSGNVGLMSDYRFRGQSQTENDPALQGSFTLAHHSGFYFSTFASNVNFSDDVHMELDPSVGFSTPVHLGTLTPLADVGLAYYSYPSASDYNYLEAYAKLSFADTFTKGDDLTPSMYYSNEYGGKAGRVDGNKVNNWNFNLQYSLPIAETGFGAVASVGYSKASESVYGNDDNFVDWKVGATYDVKAVQGLTAELDVVGTNIDGYTGKANRAVDTGALFSLTKAF